MSEINIALLSVGALIMILGLLSRLIKSRTPVSEPLAALLLGVFLGPVALGLLNPSEWGDQYLLLEQAARLTLAIGLMGVALRLPPDYLLHDWRSVAALVVCVMPLMWLSAGLSVYAVFGFSFWVAFLIGAVVTPTDPIVATSIVTGDLAEKSLPDRIRHSLSAESGANDGLALPIALLPILVLTRPAGDALPHWLLHVWLKQVGLGVVFGIALGWGAGRLLVWAESHKSIERTYFLAYTIALSLFTLGFADLLGAEGILAVFVAGLAFDMVVGSRERAEEEGVQEMVSQFFTLPIFVLLGLMLPWQRWAGLGWRGAAVVALVLLLRRLPAVLACKPLVPALRRTADALFCGWFGPIGVAALYYAMLAMRRTGDDTAWVIGSLLVASSIVAHGTTAMFLTKMYARRIGTGSAQEPSDS